MKMLSDTGTNLWYDIPTKTFEFREIQCLFYG